MKKIKLIKIISLLLVLSLASCEWLESDEDKIKNLIYDLEDSINSKDLKKFIKNFHTDCNLYLSYNQAQFDLDFGGTTYNYHDLSVSGLDEYTLFEEKKKAEVSAAVEINGIEYSQYFHFKKDGDHWKIIVWFEQGDTLFYNIKPAQ